MKRFRGLRGALVAVAAAVLVGGAAYAAAGHDVVAGPRANGTGVTPIGWTVDPAGKQVTLGDRPYGLAESPNGRFVLASNDGQSTQSLQVIDAPSGAVTQTLPYSGDEALSFGIAFAPDGSKVYVSAGGNNKIRVYSVSGESLTEQAPLARPPGPVRPSFGD